MAEPRRTIQVIMGPRQVGKSTMISQFVELTSIPCSLFSADSVGKTNTEWISEKWHETRIRMMLNNEPEHLLIIDEIQKRIQEDPDVRFFLATDSEAEEEQLIRQFGNKILVQKGKDLSRNSTTGIQNALVDLLCLSYCDEIWGSYWSSFSETAAAWHGKKKLRIISVKG